MHKPSVEVFEQFERKFRRAGRAAGKDQYLALYFIAGYPGSDLHCAIDVALYLKRTGHRPDKVQDFIPVPMDIATCMYHTGLDPISGEDVYVPNGARERRLQRALMQYFKPENYADVRRALEQAGRLDLIGDGPECLIPSRRPKDTGHGKPQGRRRGKSSTVGYRPHRKTVKKRKT